jgi:hypothetical protein
MVCPDSWLNSSSLWLLYDPHLHATMDYTYTLSPLGLLHNHPSVNNLSVLRNKFIIILCLKPLSSRDPSLLYLYMGFSTTSCYQQKNKYLNRIMPTGKHSDADMIIVSSNYSYEFLAISNPYWVSLSLNSLLSISLPLK